MEKHFVKFYSPGTFVAEETTKPIDSWDVEQARAMADEITERYNATPYGFQFLTRSRKEDELDSSVTNRSGMYFINGVELTLSEVKAENNPDNRILISNMESNNFASVFKTTKGWAWTQPINKDDVVLESDTPQVEQ